MHLSIAAQLAPFLPPDLLLGAPRNNRLSLLVLRVRTRPMDVTVHTARACMSCMQTLSGCYATDPWQRLSQFTQTAAVASKLYTTQPACSGVSTLQHLPLLARMGKRLHVCTCAFHHYCPASFKRKGVLSKQRIPGRICAGVALACPCFTRCELPRARQMR